jgi:hypothetical protein
MLNPKGDASNASGCVSMTTLLQALAIGVLTGGLLLSNPTSAQLTPSAKKAARVRITQGPDRIG